MKKLLALLLIFPLFIASCSDDNDDEPGSDVFWDFTNYSVGFHVTDNMGNNLLDSDVEGNMLENDIYIEYAGKTYRRTALKDNMPMPLDLRTIRYGEDNTIFLSFGEFSPTRNYKNESFTIHWGDGTKDVIKFDLYITWHKGEPTVHRALYLNDQLYSDTSFLISLKKDRIVPLKSIVGKWFVSDAYVDAVTNKPEVTTELKINDNVYDYESVMGTYAEFKADGTYAWLSEDQVVQETGKYELKVNRQIIITPDYEDDDETSSNYILDGDNLTFYYDKTAEVIDDISGYVSSSIDIEGLVIEKVMLMQKFTRVK